MPEVSETPTVCLLNEPRGLGRSSLRSELTDEGSHAAQNSTANPGKHGQSSVCSLTERFLIPSNVPRSIGNVFRLPFKRAVLELFPDLFLGELSGRKNLVRHALRREITRKMKITGNSSRVPMNIIQAD